MDRDIRIVHREVIPLIEQVQQGGDVHILGELRDFRWHDQLREFMPDPGEFSISWVQLEPDEVLQPHTHPIQTMLVIYAGSGGLLGDLRRPLRKGDIVVVPPGCAHGFVGGPDRLSGLSIQFGHGLYSNPEQARVVFSGEGSGFESTAAYNESRLEEYRQGPLFALLTDGTLDHPDKRLVHLDNLTRWLAGYHRALLAFEASAPPDRIGASSSNRLPVEASPPAADRRSGDPLLEAFVDWFGHRMYVLDFHEKAAVLHLVLGQAIDSYVRQAAGVLDLSAVWPLDKGVDSCLRELRSQSPGAHQRLRRILGEAWDMIRAMSERMASLARAA
jgi:quercetin dioxygenase-like cupin family protein